MYHHSRTRYSGQVRVTTWRRTGAGLMAPVAVEEFPNLVTDAGLDAIASLFANGNAIDLQIKRVALGTDATAPAAGDTDLGAEQFRKQVTAYSQPGTGQNTTTAYIAPGEANTFTIEEVGWFIGAATGVAGSGTLLARVAYSRAKVASEALQIDRTDTLSR